MSPSVKRYYVSSILTLGAIFFMGCGTAYVGRDQMFAMSMFKTYVKVCRPDTTAVSTNQPPVNNETLVEKPEMARWKVIRGNTADGTVEAIPREDVPVVAYVHCLEIGNNTPPQGFWANFFEFLAAAAPVVGLAFGVPAL